MGRTYLGIHHATYNGISIYICRHTVIRTCRIARMIRVVRRRHDHTLMCLEAMMSCTSYMIVLTHILRVVHVSAGNGARDVIPSIVALFSRLRAYSS